MQFFSGLALGVIIGAGGMWAVTAKPWRSEGKSEIAPADAGPVVADKDSKGKKRKRRGRRGRNGNSETIELDEPPPTLSAADRQMTWRGPAISLPARNMDFGSGDEGRPLTPGEINQVTARSSKPVLSCIEEARAGAMLKTTVKINMLVGGDGRVSKVRVGAPRWLMEHGFFACATAAAKRFRFPATGAATVVDAPYDLY